MKEQTLLTLVVERSGDVVCLHGLAALDAALDGREPRVVSLDDRAALVRVARAENAERPPDFPEFG